MKKIMLIFYSFLFFISCNNKNESPKIVSNDSLSNPKNNLVENIVSVDSFQLDNKAQEKIIANNTKNRNNSPFEPEILAKFLPDIRGAEKLPINFGRQSYDNKIWTSASTDYKFKGGTGFQIIINDYVNPANFPTNEYELFQKVPSEPGYKTTPVINQFGKGFKVLDITERNGYIYFLINDRFTVKLDGYNLSKSISLESIFNQIDLNKIKNIKQ